VIAFDEKELRFIRGAVVDAKQFLLRVRESADGHYTTIINIDPLVDTACSILDKIDNKDLQSSGHNYK